MKKLLFAGLVFFVSCKSTESINRFAKSAGSAMVEINRSTPGFNDLCRMSDPAALSERRDTSLYGKAVHPVIRCGEYKKADSLTALINQTLFNYFSMLQAVSDKKLLAYNARDLVNSMADIQTTLYPMLSLNDEKISAVKGILNTILNEPLKWYRYNKLVATMRGTDTLLARVTAAYSFILDSALEGEINQAKQNYTSFVYAPLYEWSRTPVEKWIVNQQYSQFLLSMDEEQVKIRKSVILLRTIQKDHRLLAFGKPASSFADTEAEITRDILLINKLISELIQLIK